MRVLIAFVIAILVTSAALASEEQIHHWKATTVTASTDLFGDVEMKATADDKGNLKALTVTAKGKKIDVPPTWIATLPAVPISSIEVRTERGYDPDPWLYAVFRSGPRGAKGAVELHIAFQGGKLKQALVETFAGNNTSKTAFVKAP